MARHRKKNNVPAHLAHQTNFTRTGKLDLTNRKPYRTVKQKAEASRTAVRCEDGAWRSSAPVSYHRNFRVAA